VHEPERGDALRRRSRYVGSDAGAPPVPPPGGYRGASRLTGAPPAPTAAIEPPADGTAPAPRTGVLAWIALGAAIVLASILLVQLAIGATDAIYSTTMLVLQLVGLGVIVAAVAGARGRRIGVIALAIVLVLNVGTVGALAALRTSASGSYAGEKTEEQKFWEAFPGIKDVPSSETLAQPSLERTRESADAVMADVRAALTAEFGYTWVAGADETVRPERNGYGGESMLVEFWSQTWATVEPITDLDRKYEVMAVIDRVIDEHGFWGIISFNDPSSGLDPSILERMYGTADPATQPLWEWYSNDGPGVMHLYAGITDLTLDTTGEFLAARQAQTAGTTEPLEGLTISILGSRLLGEADRDAFESALQEYPPGS
jgi:hypothetical protein